VCVFVCVCVCVYIYMFFIMHMSTNVLGTFAKLRKANISYVISVRLYVRTEQLGSHWTDFNKI